jgi:excinuclease UvrABC nuclease subunit
MSIKQENGRFTVYSRDGKRRFGTYDSKEKAEERLTQIERIYKAKGLKVGDFVSWDSSGGRAQGKIVRVVRDGKINVPDSSFTIAGTEDDPAALIQLYRDGERTDRQVGHKLSTLNLIRPLEKMQPTSAQVHVPTTQRERKKK